MKRRLQESRFFSSFCCLNREEWETWGNTQRKKKDLRSGFRIAPYQAPKNTGWWFGEICSTVSTKQTPRGDKEIGAVHLPSHGTAPKSTVINADFSQKSAANPPSRSKRKKESETVRFFICSIVYHGGALHQNEERCSEKRDKTQTTTQLQLKKVHNWKRERWKTKKKRLRI